MTDTAPDLLTGNEGDTTFVRRDLATTVTAACAYVLEHDGRNLSGYEVDQVEMLPVPAHFTNVDAEWWTVVPGTHGATKFWRFQS